MAWHWVYACGMIYTPAACGDEVNAAVAVFRMCLLLIRQLRFLSILVWVCLCQRDASAVLFNLSVIAFETRLQSDRVVLL